MPATWTIQLESWQSVCRKIKCSTKQCFSSPFESNSVSSLMQKDCRISWDVVEPEWRGAREHRGGCRGVFPVLWMKRRRLAWWGSEGLMRMLKRMEEGFPLLQYRQQVQVSPVCLPVCLSERQLATVGYCLSDALTPHISPSSLSSSLWPGSTNRDVNRCRMLKEQCGHLRGLRLCLKHKTKRNKTGWNLSVKPELKVTEHIIKWETLSKRIFLYGFSTYFFFFFFFKVDTLCWQIPRVLQSFFSFGGKSGIIFPMCSVGGRLKANSIKQEQQRAVQRQTKHHCSSLCCCWWAAVFHPAAIMESYICKLFRSRNHNINFHHLIFI